MTALTLTGCASSPDKLAATYISPLVYKDYNCDQIVTELSRVSRRTAELHTTLKNESDTDSWQTAAGIILFWPALFFLEGGDGPQAVEYSRLKGEKEALEQAFTQKKM